MHKPNYRNLLFAGFVVFSVRMTFTSTAAADPTSENVTKLKEGIGRDAGHVDSVRDPLRAHLSRLVRRGINLFRRHG